MTKTRCKICNELVYKGAAHSCGPPLSSPVDLRELQLAIELHLSRIEKVLGPNYKLTLLARYHGAKPLKDADLLMTMDTRENMLAVIDRHIPQNEMS